MTGREKKFCSLFLGSGNSELAAEKAGYTGDCEQKGEELICRPEISAELERLSRLREKSLANMAAAGYQRLAFGSICDAISLLYKSDPSKEDLEGMDLFLVSEIKRPKDGSMEIKFFDRLKALEKLGAGGEHETGAKQLFDAISNSARAVNDKENGIKTFSKKLDLPCFRVDRESAFVTGTQSSVTVLCAAVKTFCMSLSFILWSFYDFANSDFALCGKTIRSLRRNMITPVIPILKSLGFKCEEKLSQNILTVSVNGVMNRFYLFGGKDESSASLIQGMTLSGVLFDEVALMPRSFVEQALARCSVSGSRFWFNCNPEFPEHWFYREWIKKCGDKNALYLHFTMQDNPSLKPEVIKRYESLYSGRVLREVRKRQMGSRFRCGVSVMDNERMYCDIPSDIESWAVSCDYGLEIRIIGLWGEKNGVVVQG